jgi:hypothetical protein
VYDEAYIQELRTAPEPEAATALALETVAV